MKKQISVVNRLWQSLRTDIVTIVFAISAAFLITGVFISALGVNPLEALNSLLHGVFGRVYGIGETLVKATPLLIIGLGVSIALKGGLTNLGGDGQFYMGALAAIWVGTTLNGIPTFLHIILIIIFAALAGAIWGGIAGFLKAKLNTNEVIMTIMMNYIAINFVSFITHGPLKDPNGFLPQTKQIASNLRLLPVIPKTRAHFGIVIALIAAVLVYILVSKTIVGYRIRAVGLSTKASVYAGINTSLYTTMVLAISGAFAGIAGMIEVYGIHFRLLDGISSNFGFTGIVVALLGKLHPAGIIIASLFMGFLTVGANSMQVSMKIPMSIVYITQSLVILFMLICSNLKLEWFKKVLPFKSNVTHEGKEVALDE